MTKPLMVFFLCTIAFIMSCSGGTLTSSCSAEDAPLLTDLEEYEVFAAVLFPKGPDLIAPATNAGPERKENPDTLRVRLDGITGNSYRLSRFTIHGEKTDKDFDDQFMIGDYNRRNEQAYRLDEERLLPLVPKGGNIALVAPEKFRMTGEGIMPSGGTTYISRPGFNQGLTRAILQINHVAGLEMGVGYQVYLEKSPSGGNWLIIGLDLNRRY